MNTRVLYEVPIESKSKEYSNFTPNFLCRLCATILPGNKCIDLRTHVTKCREINKKLSKLNSETDFNDSILPSTVCFECCSSLQDAYDFVTGIDHAKTTLQNILFNKRNLQQDNIKVEDTVESNQSISDDEPPLQEQLELDKQFEVKDQSHVKSESQKIPDSTLYTTKKEPDIQKMPLKRKPTKNILCNSSKDKTIMSNKHKIVSLNKTNISTQQKYYDFLETSEDESETWICSLCESQFPECSELIEHSMKDHKRCHVFHCSYCKRKSSKLTALVKHTRKVHKHVLNCSVTQQNGHLNSQHICPGCNSYFSTEEELDKHKNTYYKPQSFTEYLKQFQGKYNDTTCLLCGKSFKVLRSLYKHLIVMHNDHLKPFVCHVCGKSYIQENFLKDHLPTHNNLKLYKCDVCQASFKNPPQLKAHAKKHDPRNRVLCGVCGKEYATKPALRGHMRKHEDYRPHVCNLCNKGFKTKGGLVQHKRQHTGEKPFKCDACSLSFTNWSNHHRHMKLYHGKMSTKKQLADEGSS